MSVVQDESRMLRKQYHLSAVHVRRIEALRAELGVSSDAEVIRRAIDSFDADALDTEARALVESTAEDLRDRIAGLNARIEETLERVGFNREQRDDPEWIEGIQARTRREAASDPALVAGMAELIGA